MDYFRLKERQVKFLSIVEGWIGTPYHHMWNTKNRGVDCSLLIAECLKEQGILISIIVKDYYPTDWHINSNDSLLVKTVENAKFIKGITIEKVEDKLVFGDILLFTFVSTRVPHHSAIYIGDNTIVQAGKDKVCKTDLDRRWLSHLISVYRIME